MEVSEENPTEPIHIAGPSRSADWNTPSLVAGPSRCTDWNTLLKESSVEWNTPDERHVLYYEQKEKERYKIPTPFKKCLVSPRTPEKAVKTPRQRKQLFPAVVSSGKYRECYTKETEKKNKKGTPKQTSIKAAVVNEESTSESEMEVTYEDEELDISEQEILT